MKLQSLLMPMALIGARKLKPMLLDNYGIDALRGVFVASLAATFVLLLFLQSKIKSKKDTAVVKVTKPARSGE